MYGLARPFLFALDAEKAHDLGLKAMAAAYRSGLNPLLASRPMPLPTEVFGLRFDNPVGLAAGLDKNGAYVDAMASLGFGFIEVGTTTPKAQPGNPKPRMFRLPEHEAVINRLGFNNEGVDALLRNLECVRFKGPLGINIGKNKDTPNERAVDDYLMGLNKVYARADYITVNISSPNTQGLRDLQSEDALRRLVASLIEAREANAGKHGKRVPVLVKIAPDLTEADLDGMAEVFLSERIDGLILTNTTIAREAVRGHRYEQEAGGLSGRPVFAPSTATLRAMHARIRDRIPMVGVGGILAGADALAKLDAGASLVQCYTGLVYRGPALIGECVEAIRMQRARAA